MFATTPPPIISPIPEQRIARSTWTLINLYRRSRNLPALVWDDAIAVQCQTHSNNMANGVVPFGHAGFETRSIALLPWLSAAENVTYNIGFSRPAVEATKSWLASPAHRANIVGDFNRGAIGVARSASGTYFFTQIFIKR